MRLKNGDTYPFVGRVSVTDVDDVTGLKTDVTALQDFSTWTISCEYRTGPTREAALLYDVPTPFINGGPVFDCSLPSAITATFAGKTKVYVDLRIKDAQGVVRSTDTRELVFNLPVSETP